jgi:DNA-binding MarR family transcriptional regulator
MPVQHYKPEMYRARGSVGYLIKRAHSRLVDHLEAVVTPSDLNFTQWVVLMYLRDGLALNASDLCTQLRYDSGALTRVIDQLESRGLVQRERSREDRRAVELRLTEAGADIVNKLVPKVVDRLNYALRDFSRAEAAQLNRLLGKLIASLDGTDTKSGEAA